MNKERLLRKAGYRCRKIWKNESPFVSPGRLAIKAASDKRYREGVKIAETDAKKRASLGDIDKPILLPAGNRLYRGGPMITFCGNGAGISSYTLRKILAGLGKGFERIIQMG